MLFEQCPRAYQDRYVHGLATEPSLAMLFGHAVHTALEVLLQGQGGVCPVEPAAHADHVECARSRYWQEFDTLRGILARDGIEATGLLYLEGLRMVDQVAALGLNADSKSRSERRIKIPTQWAGMGWPVVGAVDLWSPPWSQHGAVVWDFKTTIGSWSQTRAEKERWQPMLYSWAYVRAFGVVPTFRYLVLNRATGTVETFDRAWMSRREFDTDLKDLHVHAEEIAEMVAAGNFDCSRGHGYCLECGDRFGHDHECKTPKRATVKLSGRSGLLLTQP
jgi:hypothetical protein